MNEPKSRKIVLYILGLMFFISVSIISFLQYIPPSTTPSNKVIFIKKGTPLKKVSMILKNEGLIKNEKLFIIMATLLWKRTKIKAGEYELNTKMFPHEILSILVRGEVKRHLVTISEGLTLNQIAQLLSNLNIVDKDSFIQKATDPAFISSLGIPYLINHNAPITLEGYLYPETYHLFKGMEPEEVIHMMVKQFQRVFGADLMERASQLGITLREAVIIASIIEKETSLPEEKPLISAVFYNRLKRNMPLQSDPTVIYGIKDFDGNLTKAHLMRPSPYNTYISLGLPPTPICNPGKDSIIAALYPASVPFLYFVSKNDGSHHFSTDIEEHQRAVFKYQKLFQKEVSEKVLK